MSPFLSIRIRIEFLKISEMVLHLVLMLSTMDSGKQAFQHWRKKLQSVPKNVKGSFHLVVENIPLRLTYIITSNSLVSTFVFILNCWQGYIHTKCFKDKFLYALLFMLNKYSWSDYWFAVEVISSCHKIMLLFVEHYYSEK